MGAKIFESKFLSLMVPHRTNLNTSVGKMLDVSYDPFSTLVQFWGEIHFHR